MKAYTIQHYENGAIALFLPDNKQVVIYNTGDIVELVSGVSVSIKTHDGIIWKDSEKQQAIFDALNEFSFVLYALQRNRI